MSASVKLSLRAARVLLGDGPQLSAQAELRQAIARAERTSEVKARLCKPKAAKKRAQREATSNVRAAVMERAGGKCEACPNTAGAPLELDHFFGRARAESVETCWILCRNCHHWKTENHPDAAFWLLKFIDHADFHGYAAEAERAGARVDFVAARGGL